MTIPEHIEILRRGPRVWNAWRAENPSIVPDLEGIALSIGDRQLGPMNGGPINLSRALLADATLYFATLTGADMRGTDLTNADLRGARLEGVDLTGADLAGANLDGANLSGAVLKAANLSGASLADVRDLTTDQIGEAEGNLGTVLPQELQRPALWSVGQGILHIETARDAVEEEAYEAPAAEAPAEPARMSFYAAPEPEETYQPEETPEPEPAAYVEPEPEPEPEPVQAAPVETTVFSPAPALPKVEASRPQPAPERFEPQRAVMRSNGHDTQGNEPGDNENKHVSWLVGGPRRAGRPARNWRDRA
ncbi:pentapeptide repeat-containing protein [Methyloceanibacter sp. wino2]|uniref:pentapeptide repeat-containing protein n=1 Tax=Methyloceanibacter sp. wino2 TaxID=2170729 RepID=UPI000D3E31C9|nr:pentapeptide repeat-containing protein [Methyloceanibacter sp. wino2]